MCRFPLQACIGLNVVLLLWKIGYSLQLQSQSTLCKSMDLPCKHENPDKCRIKYYKLNSTECKDLLFNEKLQSQSDTSALLGNVELKSYYFSLLSFKVTAFNVTFSNIKWRNLKFRFKQIGNEMKNTCREFFMLPNSTISDLFYDCVWSNETFEGKQFSFEYEASDDVMKMYKKFMFHVPYSKNIKETSTPAEDWEIFLYVEILPVSNSLEPTTFYIYWQTVPKKFSIEYYNISVISKDKDIINEIYSENVKCGNETLCKFKYSAWDGTLKFKVQPACKNHTSCPASETLFFQVGVIKAKPLIIGLISAPFILFIVLYIIFMLRKYVTVKERLRIRAAPKLLVIYSSSVPPHVNVVLSLVEYFKNYCNIEPLVDELEIFSSKSKDPFKWCNKSFKIADFVMVVASPCFKSNSLPPNSIYRNMDALLLRLLRQNLGADCNKKNYFVLMLPYSSEMDVPSEAENLRRFYFPCDLNHILRLLYGNRTLPVFFRCEPKGGKEDYKFYGENVKIAIEKTQKYLEERFESEFNEENFERYTTKTDIEDLLLNSENGTVVCDVKLKENIDELVEEVFMEYPGPVENFNLIGEGGNRTEESVNVDETTEDAKIFNINSLNL